MGAACVLIKGGHRRGAAIDVLYDGKKMFQLATPRIDTPHTHGTGCTLASAIAVELTRSDTMLAAVTKAKEFVAAAISHAEPLGKGQGPLNPYPSVGRDAELYRTVQALQQAFQKLQTYKAGSLIPEVQSNLGYALPEARTPEDVVAFPGRIVRLGEEAVALAYPEPGASHHVASIILTAMSVNPRYRAAMNIRFGPDVLQKCRQLQWRIARFDRRKEPDPVKQREGASLEWGIGSVLRRSSAIPDIIYDLGDFGKEPMIRVLGKTPEEVVNKVLCLL
jgi:hydroxymethylpyrimidine/phosphomethylpyrimidine kinase